MRREQVYKICLNHYLSKDMEFRKKDDKTFYWAAFDYSEATPQNETFAIRFKTPEITSEFMNAVSDAKVKLMYSVVLYHPPPSSLLSDKKCNKEDYLYTKIKNFFHCNLKCS